jgi:hypothetical protein
VIRDQVRRVIEGGVSGVAYASGLVALSAFLVGSFRPRDLSHPYVGHLAWLRVDSFGVACFFVATVGLATSSFLRRSRLITPRTATDRSPGTINLFATAVARSLIVAGTTLVVYISVNAVTHPITLGRPVTHLLSWPTEGTLRAVSLVVVAFAVAVDRAMRTT